MIGLGAQTELGIGIAIQLQDQYSATADKVLGRMKMLKNETVSIINQQAAAYRNQSAVVAAGSFAIADGFWGMAKATSEFGHRINQVDIIGEGKLGKTKRQLADMAKNMGRDFATMPMDVSGAMFENAKQGVTRGMSEITRYQLAVSKATDENLGSVSNHLLHIMNAYDMTAKQFPRIANAITAAANATTASVSSIGEGMQYAAFPAHQFNVRLEETLALVSKLQQSGINASGSGTALQNMFTYLGISTSSQATKKQKHQWDMLGLDRKQMADWMNMGKVFDVMAAIDKQLTHIAPTERAGILRGLVNVRGTRAQLAAFGSNDPDKTLEGILRSIDHGVNTDVAMRQSKAMMNDPYGMFLKKEVEWENAKINFLQQAAPMLTKMLTAGIGVINVMGKIASTPVGTVFAAVVGVGAPLIGTLFALRAAALTAAIALRGFGAVGLGNSSYRDTLAAVLGQGITGQGGVVGNANSGIGPNGPLGSKYYTSGGLVAGSNWMGFNRQGTNPSYKGAGNFNSRNRHAGAWDYGYHMLPGLNGNQGPIAYGDYWKKPIYGWPAAGQSNPFGFIKMGGNNPGFYGGAKIPTTGPMPGIGTRAFNVINTRNVVAAEAAVVNTATNTAKMATGLSGMVGGITKMASGIFLWLPEIAIAATLIGGIVAWMKGKADKEDAKKNDPDYLRFKAAAGENLYNYENPWWKTQSEKGGILHSIMGARGDDNSTALQQTININVDGKRTAQEVFDNNMDDNLVKHLHFNV